MKHNFEVKILIKENLDEDDKTYIQKVINKLKKRYGIIQEGNIYYRNEVEKFDDYPYSVSFALRVSRYTKYFEIFQFNNIAIGEYNRMEFEPKVWKERHNIEVVIFLKQDLSEEDETYILNEIEKYKKEFGIIQDGNLFYRNERKLLDDFHIVHKFGYMMSKYKEYFEVLYLNSMAEGIYNHKL
ncbi:hypothetical protein [Streptococcus suis]|uniref:hypothetical protein n=1 Tax=Streptococcus parasuis TaxID=1501662 RepID=UPI001557EE42|nr:hypothetical protein [Streptococcus suis]